MDHSIGIKYALACVFLLYPDSNRFPDLSYYPFHDIDYVYVLWLFAREESFLFFTPLLPNGRLQNDLPLDLLHS